MTTNLDVVDAQDGVVSLREAVAEANGVAGADVIDFDPALWAEGPATILLTQGEFAISGSLEIDGPGVDLLTIDAQERSRVFHVDRATAGDVAFAGMTLLNGLVSGNNATNSDTTFSGGAIRSATLGTLTLDHVVIRDSGAVGSRGRGGGVFAAGPITLTDSALVGNRTAGTSSPGGGVYAEGAVSLLRTSVTRNEGWIGGGVYSSSSVSIIESLIDRNTSRFFGGGIRAVSGVKVVGSTISQNTASGQGGGIHSWGPTEIWESTISGNFANGSSGEGGGIYVSASLRLWHSTVVGNYSGHQRGGIYASNDSTIASSIVAGNTTATTSPDIAIFGNLVIVVRSLIGDGSTVGLTEAPLGAPDAYGNLIGGPSQGRIDPLLGPLAANGGRIFADGSQMLTHAPLPDSPAVDVEMPEIAAPRSWYRFEELAATVAVDSVGGHDGTYYGNPALGESSARVTSGNAVELDGVDDYIAIPGTIANSFSISLWLKTSQPGLSGIGWGLIDGDLPGSAMDVRLSIVDGRLLYQMRGSSVPSSGPLLNDGKWHHVVATRNSANGDLQLYVDGVRISPPFLPGVTGPTNAAAVLRVGQFLTGQNPYQGSVDELAIYDRVLTPAEVFVLAAPDLPEFDQRGGPWSRVAGGRIDMGAVEWQVNPLGGDYNFDGVVDAADYSVWRDTVGSTNDLRADGSSATTPGAPDGVVDEHDYAWWKANFGNVMEQGAGSVDQGVTGFERLESAHVNAAEPRTMTGRAAVLRSYLMGLSAGGVHAGLPPAEPGAGGAEVAVLNREAALLAWAARWDGDRAEVDDAGVVSGEAVVEDHGWESLDEVFATLVCLR